MRASSADVLRRERPPLFRTIPHHPAPGEAAMDACELPYVWHGDIRACHLPLNHDGACYDPHRAAFLASLEARQAAAYAHWVF